MIQNVSTQAGSGDITPAVADGSTSQVVLSGRAAAVVEPPEPRHKPAEARSDEKHRRWKWTPDQVAILRDLYPTTRAADIATIIGCRTSVVLNKASQLGLRKTPETIAALSAAAMKNPNHPGRAHHFRPGHEPWNKGTHFTAGGRSAETRFKPGMAASGNAALIVKPMGHERINKDGYRERKINNDKPFKNRWRAVHLLLWEAENGPLPPGHAVTFINGDKTDIRLDNLRLISRSDLMLRNSFLRYGPEIVKAIQMRGQVVRRINKLTQEKKP